MLSSGRSCRHSIWFRRCRIDAGVEIRSYAGVVDEVRLRLGLRHFNRDLRRMITETLVRPDWSRWTAFDRASQAGLSADQGRIQRLLGLVRFRRRNW